MLPQILLIVVVAGGAALKWWFSADQEATRRLKTLTSVLIADATEGALVKVTGRLTLAGDTSLEAPLSGRRCAAYRAEVEERRSSGKSSHWVNIIRDDDVMDFAIEDDTGRALIKAIGAKLVIERDDHQTSGTFNDASERAEAFLMLHGKSSESFLGLNKGMRYQEGVLEPGEEVTVLGKARWEMDPDKSRSAGYRDRAKRLVIDMADDGTLIISDDLTTLD